MSDMVVNYHQAFVNPVKETNLLLELTFLFIAVIWTVSQLVVHFLYIQYKPMCDQNIMPSCIFIDLNILMHSIYLFSDLCNVISLVVFFYCSNNEKKLT